MPINEIQIKCKIDYFVISELLSLLLNHVELKDATIRKK